MLQRFKGLLYKKLPQIFLMCLADIVIFIATSYFVLGLRFDFSGIPANFLRDLSVSVPFGVLLMIVIFYFTGLYTSVWRYASITELLSVAVACTILECALFVIQLILSLKLPVSFYFIHIAFMFIMICGVRFSYRIIRMLVASVQEHKGDKIRTLLVGAGDAGKMVIDGAIRGSLPELRIVCIVDDDKKRKGTRLRNIPIVGGRYEIKDAVEKYKVKEIIIAIPSASKSQISKIIAECQKTDCEIKILPSFFTRADGDKTEQVQHAIRPISYEDFLGRDQITVNIDEISSNLVGKTILVTGGGGSIGSELCRQIAKCRPKLLIIFDIYENNAYDIQQELYREHPDLDLETIIGSVRDYDRLEKVFEEFHPDQVYHAAAHKHVPLMEVSPNEAIKNNCLGTLNTVKLADKYGVDRFVLVSTDKAVRPTNIMGASKRICEMIVQAYDKISKTDYVAVRFGNVLGSNGSVIPLFLKQIEAGGPVTVTHKDVMRYFMTIPEAVSLILQASVYAEGGEIFVLDMGKPVKIYELAKQIIRYKGLEPGKDIEIKFTGLRPGEKLFEELLMDEEGMKEPPNKLIHIGRPIRIKESFLDDLDDLIKAAQKNGDDIKERTAKMVGTYKMAKEAK